MLILPIFIQEMLCVNPARRILARRVLEHAYFKKKKKKKMVILDPIEEEEEDDP
ncbi:hypothetical protein HYC85_016328 [Camellia sinensis]|uniref:Protein kinase domain-containing protein n=1 Tax=Camellia sinensis TaxID=4442 RepID=A0A7J7GZJ8_CAMSI|nr:hypothetical protein HYC85_016328 [Camellia sinensis]